MLLATQAYASENCVIQFKGECRTRCLSGEAPAEGAFIDCDEKQECCVPAGPDKYPDKDSDKNKDNTGGKEPARKPEPQGERL